MISTPTLLMIHLPFYSHSIDDSNPQNGSTITSRMRVVLSCKLQTFTRLAINKIHFTTGCFSRKLWCLCSLVPSLVPRLVRGRGEKSLVHTVCACSVPPGFLGIRKLADITPYTIPSIIVFFVRCTTIEDGGDFFARFR